MEGMQGDQAQLHYLVKEISPAAGDPVQLDCLTMEMSQEDLDGDHQHQYSERRCQNSCAILKC